ncbi:MAG: 16S rRNA (cytidine(1402)-2'-O)-methyltransferase [Patescibacteria group bacterium]|nr:16S rRNA (cytidine(1402)-2'-O)-methyltransferase [Patescibacteria group bacterium]
MKLYIVATPIGNLSDITFRAIDILKSVDFIFCEDTRVTKKLLNHYGINNRLESYHKFSNKNIENRIIEILNSGKNIAYVSDAGTPGISDPGEKLVKIVSEKFNENIIESIPGPSSLITALSISGFNCDRFNFLGFLPHKKGKETILKEIIDSRVTNIFFESTHRIIKTLEKLKELGFKENRKIFVARELTKKFETIYRGPIEKILFELKGGLTKGEFVVITEHK